jgi:uncharacterized membrane protein YhaH (DUF805 family)
MSLDLNKGNNELKYYYSENGGTFGPFTLSQLLDKINAETLVYREGIDWTNAKNVEELIGYFKGQDINNITETSSLNFTTDTAFSTQSPTMFAAAFSFDGRIRRTEYCISFIIYTFAYSLVVAIFGFSLTFFVAFIPLIWFLWAQGAKRCHDRGNSGWYQIIPFYIFWMFFAEGDRNINEYGHSPK